MELLIIAISACVVSALTLFSGFGLGTVLTPVFALFFPIPFAVAATAVVHFANNLFKLGLMARRADWRVVGRFGIPAAFAAVAGASLLSWLDRLPVLARYSLGGGTREISLVKIAIGTLIIAFALLELTRRFDKITVDKRYLPVGGVLSGFFRGLSGNQGAFRSAFLLKAGLSKDAFVATGIVSAVLVDATRLTIYGTSFIADHFAQAGELLMPVAVGTLAAFIGAFVGSRLLRKITLRTVQVAVAVMMLAIGVALVFGLV